MKKLVVLVLLGALALGLTACGTIKPVSGAEPTAGTEAQPITETQTTTEAQSITETQTTIEAQTTTEAARIAETTQSQAVPDPTGLSKAALVAWFNDRVNDVRAQKPKINRAETQKIERFETSLLGGVADGLINNIVAQRMPGEPAPSVIPKGAVNVGLFFANTAVSNVKASDVASASARRVGENYVVTLTLGEATDPAKNGASGYSRVFNIASASELMGNVAGAGIQGDPAKMTMHYTAGKAELSVNPKGEVITASSECQSEVLARDVKLRMFTFDLTVYQRSVNVYDGFVY
jgi:hypothetical protein